MRLQQKPLQSGTICQHIIIWLCATYRKKTSVFINIVYCALLSLLLMGSVACVVLTSSPRKL